MSAASRAVRVITVVSAVLTLALTTWMTVVAFVGGTMPVVGWETDGGILVGLLWLVFVDPIVVSACWLLTTVIVVPILALGEDE